MYTSPNYRQASILVIDDNADHWLIMQQALNAFIPQLKTIWTTGAEGTFDYLDQCVEVGKQIPKLILLDLYLPTRQEGKQLLQQLKANVHYRNTPVVVLSHSSQRDDIYEMYDLGGSSYMVKPLALDEWLPLFEALKIYWWDTTTLPLPS
ncbi:response regulator [Spirosoma sp. HMF4905]|uniref:Response regulator n=1 Tax=Spirosoma arboris TaxID=2682092 RepID=A0A7K1SNZ2_9BACT|nr:response regulator [Spirosoma arboris]MVM35520.1 response regulator [Spirosoma arboris]